MFCVSEAKGTMGESKGKSNGRGGARHERLLVIGYWPAGRAIGYSGGEFALRSSGGGICWKRGGLAPPNPPADFRCGPAGLRVPTSPRGCGHRQAVA